jgi:hypothetical protein
MPRWVFLLGIGVALVAVAFVVTDAAVGARPGVTERNAKRIREGMTMAEVTEILGENGFSDVFGRVGVTQPYWWEGETGRVDVEFWTTYALRFPSLGARPGCVHSGRWQANPSPPPKLSRIRAWFGR